VSEIDEALKEVVAKSAHELCEKGLTWGRDAGDTSLKDPRTGYIYILPRPSERQPIRSWSAIRPEDVAVVDGEGRNVGDPAVEPTVELRTHLRIYERRPDVHAIVHSHGRWSRVFSALRQPIPAYMVDSFVYTGATAIGCAKPGQVGSDEVALSALECLGAHGKAALLAAHGAVCLGKDMEEAMSVAEITEDMARLAIYVRLLGGAPEVTLTDVFGEDVLRAMLAAHAL
jgi:L-fuculose-phosphate aldolase